MFSVPIPIKTSSLETWAIFYASLNLPIIPVYEPTTNGQCSCTNTLCASIGKHPRVVHGVNDATTDIKIIQSWWRKWPHANIGIATGQASGKVVIDIDPKNGGLLSLQQIEKIFSAIPGPRVKTGGQGLHFYIDTPIHTAIKNKVNLMPGIDIRGDGGYIIAPPSYHQSGHFYEWEIDILDNVPLPDWFFDFYHLKKAPEPSREANSESIGTGSRNTFLASVAGSLKKHGLSAKSVERALNFLNAEFCLPSLESNEVVLIARSIDRYTNAAAIEWADLIPFNHKTEEIPSLSPDYIPAILREWVIDIATRMQISYELVTVPAIVAIGALIGRKIRIYPKQHDSWLVTPNLWGAIVARPGMFKSPAIAEALAPLEALVNKENAIYSEQLNRWERDRMINLATYRCLKRSANKSD
jgi:hypothetical protein